MQPRTREVANPHPMRLRTRRDDESPILSIKTRPSLRGHRLLRRNRVTVEPLLALARDFDFGRSERQGQSAK